MNWKNRMKAEYQKLADYTRDLEAKHRIAVERLSTISDGMFYTSEVQSGWSQETKLQHTATKALAKLATMQQRERPSL